MNSELDKLNIILTNERITKKRKLDDIEIRQTKIFKSINEVITDLPFEDIVEHIEQVCYKLFISE